MAHQRKLLRHTVAKILKGKTTAGDNVFANRPTPLFNSELPAIHVYVKSETPEQITCAPKILSRAVRLVTEIVAEASEQCDDILDDISEEIETIMFENGYIRDPDELKDRLDKEIEMESTEISLVADGDQIDGSCRITWIAPYEFEAPTCKSPEELDEFLTANVKFDVNQDDAAEMENTAVIREE